VVKEGFLLKRGAINQNWQKRYFVLTKDKKIYYFQKKKDTEKSLGVINFKKAKLGSEPNIFIVKDPTKAREFNLQVENPADREAWINCIHQTLLSKK
jgi:hypothetical protein